MPLLACARVSAQWLVPPTTRIAEAWHVDEILMISNYTDCTKTVKGLTPALLRRAKFQLRSMYHGHRGLESEHIEYAPYDTKNTGARVAIRLYEIEIQHVDARCGMA